MRTVTAVKTASLFVDDDLDFKATIASLVDDYLYYCQYIEHMSPHTLPTKRTHLYQFVSFCRENRRQYIEDLTIRWVDFYFYWFAQTHALSTTNTAKRIIKAFFRYLNDHAGLTSINPDAIKSRKNQKPRPRHIEHSVIEYVIAHTLDPHAKMMISLMYDTGLRIAEVCRMEYQDIDNLRLYVKGKGGKERTVYMSIEIRELLDDYIEKYGRFTGLVFRTNTKTARVWIQRSFQRCAGKHMTPHQLRHSYAVRLLLNGCDIASIQKLLGHSDISTTMVYLQIQDSVVEDQYRRAMDRAHVY